MTDRERSAATMWELYNALTDYIDNGIGDLGHRPVEITTENGDWAAQVLRVDLAGGLVVVTGPPFWETRPALPDGSRFRGWGVSWVRSLWNRTLGAWIGEPR